MDNIETYSPERQAKLAIWKRNKTHCRGSDAVKGARELYLQRPDQTMTDTEYTNYIRLTEYFPAAARTLDSYTGLTFRVPPVLKAPDELQRLAHIITRDGRSIEDQCRWLFREFLMTNDGGVLIDHEPVDGTLTVAEKEALALEPYQTTYTAESIFDIRYGRVGGRQNIVYVRMRDDADTIRELSLTAGFYTVALHTRGDNGWTKSTSLPLVRGEPIRYIPFVHFREQHAEGAHFDALCALNETHYATSGLIATSMMWTAAPIRWIKGVEKEEADALEYKAGAVWVFANEQADLKFEAFDGEGTPIVERELDRIEKHLAELGSRLVSSENAPAEAVEVVQRRNASENSITASAIRFCASRYQDALRITADWKGLDPQSVSFSLNTDFLPKAIDPQLLAQLVQLNQAGKLPNEELFAALKKGEIIDQAVSYEEYQDRLETAQIDRPVTVISANDE